MYIGADIFKNCIGITCLSGPIILGFVFILHVCRHRHFQSFYRNYMNVGVDMSRFVSLLHARLGRHSQYFYKYYMHVAGGIFSVHIVVTCMSGPIFTEFVLLIHACRGRHFHGL